MKKPKTKTTKYRSGFEKTLGEGILKELVYEPEAHIYYNIPKKYIPDFSNKKKTYFIEAKGRFRTYEEAQKYVLIKRDNPKLKLIFLLWNPDAKAYPQVRKRKDGSFMTIGEFLAKNGFEWYTKDTLPKKYRR